MTALDIRHIAAGLGDDGRFLTAEFERRAHLWSLADCALLAEFDTVLEFGGRRLALCRLGDEPVVVAGAWERHGICAYSLDGSQRWQRKDLRKVQRLAPAANGRLVTACFDHRPMHVLTAESGETLATVRAVRTFTQSPYDDLAVAGLDGQVARLDTADWKVRWRLPLGEGRPLAAAASPVALAVSGGGGYGTNPPDRELRWRSELVLCTDLGGAELWRWELPYETNCPALAWDHEGQEWVGVLYHVNHDHPETLVRWSAHGELVAEHPLAGPAADYEFLPGGRYLVTSVGDVRETTAGQVVWPLPRPATKSGPRP